MKKSAWTFQTVNPKYFLLEAVLIFKFYFILALQGFHYSQKTEAATKGIL